MPKPYDWYSKLMNDKWIVIIGSLAGIFILLVLWLWIRPPMPIEWAGIESGMARTEVLGKLPGLNTDMFVIKGIDSGYSANALPWYPGGYWHLSIRYTEDGDVDHVGCHYKLGTGVPLPPSPIELFLLDIFSSTFTRG